MFQVCGAQNIYKAWNPAVDTLKVLEGQAWSNLECFYDRLPAKAEKSVRGPVWAFSKNSTDLQIRFRTNADEITIKYIVTERLQMPHMPATGVSGVDLYSKIIDGKWLWCAGKYTFGDTIEYRFSNLTTNVNDGEYTLYLPLYNSVKWMEIKVPEKSLFKPLPARKDKPIVVYGTSIAQGACAPRPGLAWTSILGRRLDKPLVNLGFSGNGELEKEVLDLIAEVDAELYVLDCLPNMGVNKFSENELKKRIVDAIQLLQTKKPDIPILLADHAGFTNEGTNEARKKIYQNINMAFNETFDSLLTAGVRNIYRLTKKEINLGIETTVDGIHPNALGMMRYAKAYEKKIRAIFREQEYHQH